MGDTLRAELRVLGPWLFAIPLFVAGLFAIAAGMMAFKQAHQSDIANMLTAGLEGGLPLATGIVIATITAQDAALELQLTLPTAYRRTMLRRFALLFAWAALIELLAVLALQVSAPWTLHRTGVSDLLVWLAPLLWLGAMGAALALLLHSRAASGAILGVIWLVQLLFHGYFAAYGWTQPWYLFATMFSPAASFWLTNRVELLATAFALLLAIWSYLRNTEWRFHGEDS